MAGAGYFSALGKQRSWLRKLTVEFAVNTFFQGACFFFMLGLWVEPGRWPAYSLWWSQQQRLFQDAICYFILLRVMRAALLTPLTLPAGPFMAMLAHLADQ